MARRALALSIVSLAIGVSPAGAQTFVLLADTNDGVTPALDEWQTPGFSSVDCDSNRTTALRYEGAPTSGSPTLTFWRESGGGACSGNELRDGNTDNNECDQLFSIMITNSQDDVTVGGNPTRIQDYLGTACADGGTTIIWAIVTALANGSGDPLAEASFTIVVDGTPPAAPANVVGGAGQTAIDVTWDAVDDASFSEYRVYLERIAGVDGGSAACTSTTLQGGAAAPGPSSPLFVDSASGADISITPGTGSAAEQGLTEGDQAVVAVSSVDISGNESTLSNPTCVQVVSTRGFCDPEVLADGGTGSSICEGCSAGGSLPLSSWVVGALACVAWLYRRRRGNG